MLENWSREMDEIIGSIFSLNHSLFWYHSAIVYEVGYWRVHFYIARIAEKKS